MRICIYGSATDKIDKAYRDAVYELGKTLAKKGHSLVFGGGANGVMGASARGFRSANGEVLGIIPKFFGDENIEASFEDCSELILTTNMHERKNLLEDKSDAFIIAPGGIGTFDEFFSVLTNKQLGRHTKPIALFSVNNYYDHIKALMKEAISKKFVNENCALLYKCFDEGQIDLMIDYLENTKDMRLSDLKDG